MGRIRVKGILTVEKGSALREYPVKLLQNRPQKRRYCEKKGKTPNVYPQGKFLASEQLLQMWIIIVQKNNFQRFSQTVL